MPKAAKPAKPGVKASKPGAAKPGASAKKKPAEIIEEDEPQATHPTVLVVTIIALLAVLFLCYQQYSIDTTFGRVSEPTFGWPSDGGSDGGDVAADEEATEEDAEEETSGDEEESSDEEE